MREPAARSDGDRGLGPSPASALPASHVRPWRRRRPAHSPCTTTLLCAQALADAVEAGDAEAFTTAVAEFDSLTRLDAWKTALLVRVKRKLASREEVEEEDLT